MAKSTIRNLIVLQEKKNEAVYTAGNLRVTATISHSRPECGDGKIEKTASVLNCGGCVNLSVFQVKALQIMLEEVIKFLDVKDGD